MSVQRDVLGVPTITAETTHDLFSAQGYVHAQDRFWEMDFRRHVTSGRVSELFGSSQLGTDRFLRTLGWRVIAEQEVAEKAGGGAVRENAIGTHGLSRPLSQTGCWC